MNTSAKFENSFFKHILIIHSKKLLKQHVSKSARNKPEKCL